MFNSRLFYVSPIIASILSIFTINADEKALTDRIMKIMHQDKYQHATWGLFVKEAETGKVLYDLNSQQMFLPASTTKLFSMAALLHAYGDDYRFKTPVYAIGDIKDGKFTGNLVLVAQGDLTFGGREDEKDKIEFTKMDHIIANSVPGAILTKGNPLKGLIELAKQVHDKGITVINGDVIIDDRLFEHVEKRDMVLTPIMINENLIDFSINPGEVGSSAILTWRPIVPGYTVKNELKTVSAGEPLVTDISSDPLGRNIVIKGSIPKDQKDLVRTFSVKDPNHFARSAFIQALRDQGVAIDLVQNKEAQLPPFGSYQDMKPVALWTSPPLSEYAKLILKVSHNLGADLAPLLLAVHNGENNFDQGMLLLGKFVMDEVKVPENSFVFLDGAGGDENRLTPRAEVQLLEYVRKLPADQFNKFLNALPILGIDGSLADFAKNTDAVGKVYAKPGTGVSFNLATKKFFLTTQTLAGYIKGKNGQLIEFMVGVNNGSMPKIEDIFPIFEDESQITSIIYDEAK